MVPSTPHTTLPFALRRERQADAYLELLVCLGAAIFYVLGNLALRGLAQTGSLNPYVAAWACGVLLLASGFARVHLLERSL